MDNLLTSGVFYICCRNALEIQIVAGVGQPLITPAVILPDSKLIPLLMEQNCSRCGRRLSNSYAIDSCQWAGYVEAWWCANPPWKWWNGQQSNNKRMFIYNFVWFLLAPSISEDNDWIAQDGDARWCSSPAKTRRAFRTHNSSCKVEDTPGFWGLNSCRIMIHIFRQSFRIVTEMRLGSAWNAWP